MASYAPSGAVDSDRPRSPGLRLGLPSDVRCADWVSGKVLPLSSRLGENGSSLSPLHHIDSGLYCSVMQDDPVRYWQDVTNNYRQMSDGELLELAEKPEDLTDVAQQVLRDEMNRRRLKVETRKPTAFVPPPVDIDPGTHFDRVGRPFTDHDAPLTEGEESDEGAASEYTWKTLLCDCESNQHAWQLFEVLKRHGIESWVRQVSPYSTDIRGPQVYVAADQLDAAQAVAAQPIPQDIIEDLNAEVPEFVLPVCPQCGLKDDVMLASADPVNAWLCEACGAEWTDPEPEGDDGGNQRSSTP
jgi:hypothetical protein